MPRKKWTPNTELNEHLLQLREKRKWQIALRRYILERNKCSFYAPFFGLPIEEMRSWIQVQFDESLNWENFSAAWQFEHVLPLSYFDINSEADLRLCWNFTNIRVEKLIKTEEADSRSNVFAARQYFGALYQQTGYSVCLQMLQKIEQLENAPTPNMEVLMGFLSRHSETLKAVASFSAADFERLNTGMAVSALVYEKEFLKKYGG